MSTIITLFTDGLRVFLTPGGFSNVKPMRITLLTAIIYAFLLTIVSMLEYKIIFIKMNMRIIAIIFVVVAVLVAISIKFIKYSTRKQSEKVNDDNIAQVILTTLTVPALAVQFLVWGTINAFEIMDNLALIFPLLFTLYTLYVMHAGFKVLVDIKIATLATLLFVAINSLVGLIINTTISIYYYGI